MTDSWVTFKPNTQGCTEWSCPYHGHDNREKFEHVPTCPMRLSTSSVLHLNGTLLAAAVMSCTCIYAETALD